MCGIAGLVSFTCDLTDRHELAERMAGALSHRGPDQDGFWSDRQVMLAFRRNSVVDLVGGRQPMVAETGVGDVCAVLDYTGEIFNVRELRAELTARGHYFRSRSDTEVVLRAYVEWGEECASRLRGMFAFAVWDVAKSRLVLFRDRIGIYPLYYTEVEDGFLFGSEPKALFASGLCKPVVDWDGLRELLSLTPTPGLSVFRGVREVIPGEVISYDLTGLRRRRYWQLQAREHTDDLDTTVQAVRAHLEDAVRSQLVSDVPLSATLSGGLDSSVVCALISALGGRRLSAPGEPVPPQDGQLRTFSMEFDYHLTNFRPDKVHDSPDSPYAQLMSRHLGTEHRELLVTAQDVADRSEQRAVLTAMDRPVARLDMYVAQRRLSKMIRESSIVTLSGDGADELFGGYVWFHDPSYATAETFPWFGSSYRSGRLDAVPVGGDLFSGLLDRQLVKELDMASYVRDRYAEALAEVPHVDGASAHERRMRELTYLHMTRYVRLAVDRKDRIGGAVALEGRIPFCDHHLVEYVFNVPWAMKNANGREKSLLRAAVSDLVPADVLGRRKSPFPTLQDPAYGALLREQLRDLGEGTASPIVGLLDPARLGVALTDPVGSLGPEVNQLSIETAIMLDLWVREQGVTVAV